jgi:hypothetical protein
VSKPVPLTIEAVMTRRILRVATLCLLSSAGMAQTSPPPSVAVPPTPVGTVMAEWLDAF